MSHNKTICATIAAVGLLAAGGCKQQQVQSAGSGPPVVPVSIAKATQENIPVQVNVVGTVEPSSSVEVRSQVAGQLMSVHFTEGQNVAKGALMFEVDARPYQEALQQAEAALARDRAQIQQAQATLARDEAQVRNADADLKRSTELVKAGVISKSQFDQSQTSADVYRESARASQAAIESARAAIQSDQAAIDKAKLDISYCSIHAPISGRAGNLLVHAGNLVKSNDTTLVVLNQIQPIWVTFSVPEEHLTAVRRLAARQKLPVQVSAQDTPEQVAKGYLKVIDNTVDPATGTVKLKGEFNNPDAFLWPGQFVNVTLTLDTLDNATVIPTEAIQASQMGQMIYVVKDGNVVEPRIVTVGQTFDRKSTIDKGVAPGETVVIDGQMRLFPGAKIRPVDPAKIEAGKL